MSVITETITVLLLTGLIHFKMLCFKGVRMDAVLFFATILDSFKKKKKNIFWESSEAYAESKVLHIQSETRLDLSRFDMYMYRIVSRCLHEGFFNLNAINVVINKLFCCM